MTEAELLQALRDAQPPDGAEGTITTSEMAQLLGCHYAAALRAMHDLLSAGKVRPEKVWRRNMHDELQRVKGFRVI